MTAQRLVQRMMKDSIHSGRRPSGLCGAALLIAARMHDYSRTPMDIVRIVKIHESTLRKRLIEFGDTPSSMLTLDEFMAVDLEAEQDPPAFKAARKRDKERLQKLPEHEAEFTDLQREIDNYLDQELRRGSRKRRVDLSESEETDKFIRNSTLDVINECLEENVDDPSSDKQRYSRGIAPDIAAMCAPVVDYKKIEAENEQLNQSETGELDIEGLDDEEIDGYIMTEDESKYKDEMWNKLNADYLREAKAKEERLAKEKEEGKPEKKKRRVSRKKNIGPSNTAGEAIEKMLQEKKISTKINYEILKTLTDPTAAKEKETNNATEAKVDALNAPSTSSSYTATFKYEYFHFLWKLGAIQVFLPFSVDDHMFSSIFKKNLFYVFFLNLLYLIYLNRQPRRKLHEPVLSIKSLKPKPSSLPVEEPEVPAKKPEMSEDENENGNWNSSNVLSTKVLSY